MAPARTTQPYKYFDDIDPGQFEDLIRDLLLRTPVRWAYLDPVGRAGSDEGRDLVGVELFGAKDRGREWRVQVKRLKRIGKEQARKIVRKAVPDPSASPYGLVLAVAARPSKEVFDAFHDEASKRGVKRHDLWGRDTLNGKLLARDNADLRAFYFGDGHAIDGTVRIPLAIDRNPGRDLPLLGREGELEQLKQAEGDVLIEGRPGTGKTRLAQEVPGVRFVNHEADVDAIAESIRRHAPRGLVLDDAGLNIERLKTLLELRRAGYRFRILATSWPRDRRAVQQLLRAETMLEVRLLERKSIDELIQHLGVTYGPLRREILDQAGGRIGWAVALVDLAKRGETMDVVSGRGIVGEVEPYLRQVGADSVEALGLLATLSALGAAGPAEMREIDDFLRISPLQRSKLLDRAAEAGVLEPHDRRGLRVAPDGLRFALAAHWFYGRETDRWLLRDLLERWPAHQADIIETALVGAEAGLPEAASQLDALVDDAGALPPALRERYAAVSEQTARRTLAEIGPAGPDPSLLQVVATRFALPEAVRPLLDSAVGDTREEHPHPDHPVRVLGEIGNRITADGRSTFDARQPLLTIATAWLDEDPSPARALVWAKLIVHLLSPSIHGTSTDPGDPRTLHLQGGFESAMNLDGIADVLWPVVEERLRLLPEPALFKLVDLLHSWAGTAKGVSGDFGAVPTSAAQDAARRFTPRLVNALEAATDGHAFARVHLAEISRMFHLGVRPPSDREVRTLTWTAWRIHRSRYARLLTRIAESLAAEWEAEGVAAVMPRLGKLVQRVHQVGRNFDPMIYTVMNALAERVGDVDEWIAAGLANGLTSELTALMRASLRGGAYPPHWLTAALEGPARPIIVRLALDPGVDVEVARRVIDSLTDSDAWLVDTLISGDGEPNPIARELLRHPAEAIHGRAALQFDLGDHRYLPRLPDEWYPDWAAAFEDAPADRSGRGERRLEELLGQLTARDPDLVERWIVKRLEHDFVEAAYSLPDRGDPVLPALPREHRDRIVRRFGSEPGSAELLAAFLGDDADWLGTLLRDGVVDAESALVALGRVGESGPGRVPHILRFSRPLSEAGVAVEDIAGQARWGVHRGDTSSHAEQIRAAYQAAGEQQDPVVERVRVAGIRMFEEERDRALEAERQRRIRGQL